MCDHKNFESRVTVARLTDGDNGPVTGYSADITIVCADCGCMFEFIGVPGGYSPSQPMVSAFGTELRAPIKPTTEVLEGAKQVRDN